MIARGGAAGPARNEFRSPAPSAARPRSPTARARTRPGPPLSRRGMRHTRSPSRREETVEPQPGVRVCERGSVVPRVLGRRSAARVSRSRQGHEAGSSSRDKGGTPNGAKRRGRPRSSRGPGDRTPRDRRSDHGDSPASRVLSNPRIARRPDGGSTGAGGPSRPAHTSRKGCGWPNGRWSGPGSSASAGARGQRPGAGRTRPAARARPGARRPTVLETRRPPRSGARAEDAARIATPGDRRARGLRAATGTRLPELYEGLGRVHGHGK
jgi:hypothetical protein